ncbi:MAG: glycosyltransferase family 4 protein [candidate division WOR-3 bacterium]|nr:glycosyltransferase family 4 protein [Candidatus Omnitrophota bacterium]
MKILYLYKWCTFGGVERILINRAFAFKKFGIPVKAKVYFYYGGVIQELKEFLERAQLKDYLWLTENPLEEKYEHYISIDTEEAFNTFPKEKIILEYHTPYKDHASYLKKVSGDRIKIVIVPSLSHKEELRRLRPDLYDKAFVIPNFVIDEGFEEGEYFLPQWDLIPVVWVGRVDTLKNPHFIVSGLSKYRKKYKDKFLFCVVGGAKDEENFLNHIKKESFEDRVVFYPFIRFERVKAFLKLIRKRKGIFVSASKGESFGMAVAEAIYFGLPFLISNIPPHKELVEGNEKFLFKLNNFDEFIEKLNYIAENYEEVLLEIQKIRNKLEVENFIKFWQVFWQYLK